MRTTTTGSIAAERTGETGAVRVVAGELGGRRLVAPAGSGTRPTADRVREATFNALDSMGAVDGAVVLDLFAGSGALGIEALSRGAARATFVERDRAALDALRSNLATCRLGSDRAEVVVGDGPVLVSGGRLAGPWDLVLLDPPYAFEGWAALLSAVDGEVAVCESAAAVDPPAGWRLARSKRYGTTVVTICCRERASADEGDER
jgi:16S rRNA (guanine966-N2)-methyltransferase